MAENSYWTYLASSSFSGICVVSACVTTSRSFANLGASDIAVSCYAVSLWSTTSTTHETDLYALQTGRYSQYFGTYILLSLTFP